LVQPAARDLTAQVASPIARLDAKTTSRPGDGSQFSYCSAEIAQHPQLARFDHGMNGIEPQPVETVERGDPNFNRVIQ
jgi:hypothetical protein